MKIMPKRSAKRLISVVLTVLFFVAMALAIATTVFGIQSNIDVIDTKYGILNKIKKTFTPNIDDIDINQLKKNNKITEWSNGVELGMKYSQLFKNSEKSIKHYNFEAENPDGSDFFKLSENQIDIDTNRHLENQHTEKKNTLLTGQMFYLEKIQMGIVLCQ